MALKSLGSWAGWFVICPSFEEGNLLGNQRKVLITGASGYITGQMLLVVFVLPSEFRTISKPRVCYNTLTERKPNMCIPTEYTIDDPDYRGGGGLKEDAGLLHAFVKAIKQQESEHDISLTSLDNSELFEQFCKPIIEHFTE